MKQSFLSGAMYGMLIWFGMKPLLGIEESWDGEDRFSAVYLPVTHVLFSPAAGYFTRAKFPAFSLGTYFGEILYISIFRSSPMMLVGWIVLLPYVIFSILLELIAGISKRKIDERKLPM